MRHIEPGRYREALADNLKDDLMNQFRTISDDLNDKDSSSLQDILIRTYILENVAQCEHLSLKEFIRSFEKKLIDYALRISNHNQKKAASILGVKPTALCEKIKRYELKTDSEFNNSTASEFDEIMTLYLQLDS